MRTLTTCRAGGRARMAAALLTWSAVGASADELPTAPWGGFHLGGEVGAAWGDFDWEYRNDNYFNTLGPTVLGTDFDHRASGVTGGFFAGYDHQVERWLVGLEVSASAADLEQREASPFFPTIDTYSSELDWLAKVTGRVGYTWDRWLLYAKGGWAGADVTLDLLDNTAGIRAKSDEFAHGWSAGVGVERLLCERVSLGLVYDYVELGIDGEGMSCPQCGTGVGFGSPEIDGSIDVHSIRARLSIHF